MDTQTPSFLQTTCQDNDNFFSLFTLFRQVICATSLDFGFDFDEAELAKGLSAPVPAILADQLTHDVDADEFEMRFHWFLS